MNWIARRLRLWRNRRRKKADARGFDPRKVIAFEPSADDGRSYVDRVMERLDTGTVHPTLGPRLKPGAVDRARRYVDRLVNDGLGRQDRVVDYRCGTLRVGAFLIDYLDPERYFGLDLDQRLLDLGLQGLPAGLAGLKRPTLRVISDDVIASIAAVRPDTIFSLGVVQHIPPEELGVFFGNVSALAHDRTTIAIQVTKLLETPVRRSMNSWSHSLKSLESALRTTELALASFRSRDGREGFLMLRKGTTAD